MTMQDARIYAEESMRDFNGIGYVIIKLPPMAYPEWRKAGYSIDYDYEVFADYDQMKKFIAGERAYNNLDDYTYLRDEEKPVYAYCKNKIIIL